MSDEQSRADLELDSFYRLIAPYYDADYADYLNGADIRFYQRLAEAQAGPVLEMGCGTGRVLLPLARAGVEMHGMDASLAMLEQLYDKLRAEPAEVRNRVVLTQGDIRSTSAGRQFLLIFAAGNVLHSFLERPDQRAWLANVRRHLEAGGAFWFDVFQMDYRRLLSSPDEWIVDTDRKEAASGHHVRRFSRCRHEPEWQRFRVEMRWVTEDAAGKIITENSASVMQRWFTRGELENLLELEGFQVTDYLGSFAADPFGKGSTEQIIRAVPRQ
ncbi:MAG TPA: methyltransferase domain-containing protein [Bryobacteraceae bacterium]|nr:methyltransferase domain-containing protein [Bryobacteraceae bacterium]